VASGRRRTIAFVSLVVVCVIAMVVVVLAARHSAPASGASPGAEHFLTDARQRREPVILYRSLAHVAPGAPGPIEAAPLGHPGDAIRTGLTCNRVAFAGGQGLCLTSGSGFAAGAQVQIFDPQLRVRHKLDVAGLPSRARVSDDGRYGSVTLFVTGHSYAAAGTFSTQTTLIDLASGQSLGDLEQFTVDQGDHQVTAVDKNFWGVTFTPGDSDHYYATMATGGRTYLIQGSIRDRTGQVMVSNVECPSISPDGTRIAYKQRTGSSSRPWRLTVLDLATRSETHLAETRSVDDQVEWLDNSRVLYGTAGAVWSVPADGSGRPERFLGGSDSPAVVRWTPASTRQAVTLIRR
jgi:hypothetical protein